MQNEDIENKNIEGQAVSDSKLIVLKQHESHLRHLLVQPIIFRILSLTLFLSAFFVEFSLFGLFAFIAFAINSSFFWWNGMELAKSRISSLEELILKKQQTKEGEVWRKVYIEWDGEEIKMRGRLVIEKIEPIIWSLLILASAIGRYLQPVWRG